MIRPAIVFALLLSAAIMMRGVASDWRKGPPAPAESAVKKTAAAGEAPPPVVPPAKGLLQPAVPSVLPDLKSHYLFNPERMLAGADIPPAEESDSEASSGNTLGIAASMDEVTYAGSIIADTFSRAIILYPAAKSKAPPAAASKSSKSKPPAPTKSGADEHAQLEVGDVLDGYAVAEILPDKLIFTKGEERVEKLLYDPDKKRQAAPPRPVAAPPAGGPPRPQQIPVGGQTPATPGAPGTVAPGAPPAPAASGAVPPPPAVSPVPPPVVKPPATPAAAGTSQVNPFRRMVISRQTAAAPDTSKVSRPSPAGDGAEPVPPPPPGGEANPPVAAPPMPEGETAQ